MPRIGLALIMIVALAGLARAEEGENNGPSVGDKAPPFSLQGSDGKVHSLKDDLGKRAVVLAWFPKAFTSG